MNKGLKNLPKILLFLAIFIFSLKGLYGEDIWFHLATGRYVFDHRQIPVKDIFSFTAQGQTWINQGWLANLIFYLVFKVAGFLGLVLFFSFLSFFVFVVLYLILRALGVEETLSLFLVFLASFIAIARFQARPEPGSYLLLMLTVFTLIKFGDKKRLLLFLPLIFLIWANWQAGFVPFGLYCLLAFLSKDLRKPIFSASVLSFLAIFFNPNKILGVAYFFGVKPKYLMEDFTEWGTIFRVFKEKGGVLASTDNAILVLGFLILLPIFAALAYFWLKETEFKLKDLFSERGFWLVFPLPFLFLPFYANRFASLGVIFMALAAGVLSLSFKGLPSFFSRREVKVLVFSLCFLSLVGRLFLYPPSLSAAQKANPYRDEVIKFIENSGIKGRMFNVLEDGGYFIWAYPEKQVFMDGRLDIYTGTGIYDEYKKVYQFPPEEGWQEVLEKYQIEFLLLPGWQEEPMATIRDSGIFDLVYWSDYLFVLVRNDGQNKEFVEENGFKVVEPFRKEDYPKGKRDKVRDEYKRLRQLSPDSANIATSLGSIYQQMGEKKMAIEEYERALKIKPTEGMTRLALGALYSLEGECLKAVEHFEKAIKDKSRLIQGLASRNLGFVYLNCSGEPLMAHYYFKKFLNLAKKDHVLRDSSMVIEVQRLVRQLGW